MLNTSKFISPFIAVLYTSLYLPSTQQQQLGLNFSRNMSFTAINDENIDPPFAKQGPDSNELTMTLVKEKDEASHPHPPNNSTEHVN